MATKLFEDQLHRPRDDNSHSSGNNGATDHDPNASAAGQEWNGFLNGDGVSHFNHWTGRGAHPLSFRAPARAR